MASVFGNVFQLSGGASVWANVFVLTVTPGPQERISIETTSKRRFSIEATSKSRQGIQATSKRRLSVES